MSITTLNTQLVALPSTLKTGLAVAGILFAIGGYFVRPLSRNILAPPSIAVSEIPYLPHLQSMTQEVGEFSVKYSKEISQSGFGEVTVTVRLPIFHGLDPLKAKSPAFELSGPGVEVAPASRREFPIADLVEKSEGVSWTWTFRAKDAGENQLSLVATNLPYDKWVSPGAPSKPRQLENPVRLPVQVRSVSGLTPMADHYVKLGGTAAAFILAYPLVITVFRRRLNLPEKDSPPAGQPQPPKTRVTRPDRSRREASEDDERPGT